MNYDEEEMYNNRPSSDSVIPEGLIEADAWNAYRTLFNDDAFNLFYPLLEAEHGRGGERPERLFFNFCVWADRNRADDPQGRDFQTLVCNLIEQAHRLAEQLIYEQEIAENGGSKGHLISQEEMEKRRKALFKPVVGGKKEEKKPSRHNRRREEAVKKARSKNNSTAEDDHSL